MKTAIIIADGIKQIMFTPETPEEKHALSLIKPSDDITVEAKTGTLYDHAPEAAKGYTVQRCGADYLRAYEDEDSLMLVLRPKTPANNTEL